MLGTRLVRDPDGLVGRTGLGSRTWPSFFPRIAYLAKCSYLVVHVHSLCLSHQFHTMYITYMHKRYARSRSTIISFENREVKNANCTLQIIFFINKYMVYVYWIRTLGQVRDPGKKTWPGTRSRACATYKPIRIAYKTRTGCCVG